MTQRYFAALVLLLAWLPAAAFAQTISSFSPASGNAGTLVTLRGTDLNLVTAVAVNGTSCVILDKTNSTLHLLVMPAATSGPVTTTGGAPAASATAFAVTRPAVNPAQQGAKLVGTAAGGRANQGWSMALSADGNTLAVGGPYDKDGAGFTTGATWVFARSGSAWSQQGPKLVGTGTFSGHMYQGTHIALSADGNTLAVGGSISDGTGATWVFTRSGSAWSQQGPNLVGAGAESNRTQSYAVALSADGNTLAMVELYDGNRGDGATWVFTRNGTAWSQQGPKLVGAGAGGAAHQGSAVALSADGNTLAVGGLFDNNGIGAAWVFSMSGTSLAQQAAVGPRARGSFFPNPVSEQLTVTGGASRGTLRLYDSTGRLLRSTTYLEDQPLNLSALPAGLYWLMLDQAPAQPLLKR